MSVKNPAVKLKGGHALKDTKGDKIFFVINALFLGLLALIILYPLYFIVIASFSDPFNKDNCSNHVKVIDSGNLGECFDEDFDLAEWYIDENGDLCSYDVDREGFGNYVYFTFKEGTPLSVKQHFFTEAEKDDCDLTFIDEYAAPIGDMVLEALGYGSCKGGVSNGN